MPLTLSNPEALESAGSFGGGLDLSNPEMLGLPPTMPEMPQGPAQPLPQTAMVDIPPVVTPPPEDASELEQLRYREALNYEYARQGKLRPDEDAMYAGLQDAYANAVDPEQKSQALAALQVEDIRRKTALKLRQREAFRLGENVAPEERVRSREIRDMEGYETNYFMRKLDGLVMGAASAFAAVPMYFGMDTDRYRQVRRSTEYDAQTKAQIAQQSGIPLDRETDMMAYGIGQIGASLGVAAGIKAGSRALLGGGRSLTNVASLNLAQSLSEGADRSVQHRLDGNSAPESLLYGGMHALKTFAVTALGGEFAKKIGGNTFEEWLSGVGGKSLANFAVGNLAESVEEGMDYALGMGIDYIYGLNRDTTPEEFFAGLKDSMIVGAMVNAAITSPSLFMRQDTQRRDGGPQYTEPLPRDRWPRDGGPPVEGDVLPPDAGPGLPQPVYDGEFRTQGQPAIEQQRRLPGPTVEPGQVAEDLQRFLTNPSRANAKRLGYDEPKAKKRKRVAKQVSVIAADAVKVPQPLGKRQGLLDAVGKIKLGPRNAVLMDAIVTTLKRQNSGLPEVAVVDWGTMDRYRAGEYIAGRHLIQFNPMFLQERKYKDPGDSMTASELLSHESLHAATRPIVMLDLASNEYAKANGRRPKTREELNEWIVAADRTFNFGDYSAPVAFSEADWNARHAIINVANGAIEFLASIKEPPSLRKNATSRGLRPDGVELDYDLASDIIRQYGPAFGASEMIAFSMTSPSFLRLMALAPRSQAASSRSERTILDAFQSAVGEYLGIDPDDGVANSALGDVLKITGQYVETSGDVQIVLPGVATPIPDEVRSADPKDKRPRRVGKRRRGSRGGFVYTGFFVPGGAVQQWGKAAANWLRTNMQTPYASNPVLKKWMRRHYGFFARQFADTSQHMKALEAAVRKELGLRRTQPIPTQYAELLQSARENPPNTLQGRMIWRQLGPDVQLALSEVGRHIDAMSGVLANAPGVGIDLQVSIAQNLGVYITRSYKKFTDPTWKDRALADPQLMADFAAEYRLGNPNATDDQIRNVAESILNAHTSDISGIPGVNAYINVTKERKDIPPATRALMGENRSLFENYARSVEAMATATAKKYTMDGLLNEGLAAGIVYDDLMQAPPNFNGQRVSANDMPHLKALDGKYVQKDVLDALDQIFAPRGKESPAANALRPFAYMYVGAMTLGKLGKTVWRFPAAFLRNYAGNAPIALANGVVPFVNVDAAQVKRAHQIARTYVRQKGPQAIKDEMLEMVQLGLLDDVRMGEIKALASTLTGRSEFDLLAHGGVVGGTGRYLGRLYSSMDLAPKIMQFYYWQGVKSQEMGLPPTSWEVKEAAADVVLATTPSFGEVPNAVKAMRYVPLGSFVTFFAEMVRNTKNRWNLMLGSLDSNTSPAMRRAGAFAIAGSAIAMGGAQFLSEMLKTLFGVSREEELAVRERLAPWERNATLLFVGGEAGDRKYINLQTVDPFDFFHRPVTGLTRPRDEGEGIGTAVGQVMMETLEPAFGLDIAVDRVFGTLYNKSPQGWEVWNQGAGTEENIRSIAASLAKDTIPMGIQDADMLYQSLTGVRGKDGKVRPPKDALMAWGGMIRVRNVDAAMSDRFNNRGFDRSVTSSNQAITAGYKELRDISDDELRRRHLNAEEKRRDTLETWHRYLGRAPLVGDADVVGGLYADLDDSLTQSATMAAVGTYAPYAPKPEMWADLYRDLLRTRGQAEADAELSRRQQVFYEVYESLAEPVEEQPPTPAR